eukprot:355018-Chlamydomonas_euryale.AAC.9
MQTHARIHARMRTRTHAHCRRTACLRRRSAAAARRPSAHCALPHAAVDGWPARHAAHGNVPGVEAHPG